MKRWRFATYRRCKRYPKKSDWAAELAIGEIADRAGHRRGYNRSLVTACANLPWICDDAELLIRRAHLEVDLEIRQHSLAPRTIASVHFFASLPNPLALEFRASDVPVWDDLADGIHKPVMQNSFIAWPEQPEWGVSPNEEVARRYIRPDEPFFQ